MRWHIEISICILNIAIFFDISLKIEKKDKLEKVERRNVKFKKQRPKFRQIF